MSGNENLIARLTALSMNALNELPQKAVDAIFDALELISDQSAHIVSLSDALQRFEDGYQGCCYACEPVGELNVKLQSQFAALQAENAELKEAQRWIPVRERLPNEAGEVICMYAGVYGPTVASFWRDRDGKGNPHFSTSRGSEPATHWMPLPQPPASGKDG